MAKDGIIWGYRLQYFDFTIPYRMVRTSEVDHILVNVAHYPTKTLGIFITPFTLRLWITIVVTFIHTGVAVAILEYRVSNHNFGNSLYQKQRPNKIYQKQRPNKRPKRKMDWKKRRLNETNSKAISSYFL